MKRYARAGIGLATIAGIALAIWAFASTGFGQTLGVLERIGIGGFLLYCLYWIGILVLLGAAWLASTVDAPARQLGRFAAARMLREAASDLLPFSHIGGIVLATQLLARTGLALPAIYAAMIVDLTTEMIGQAVFTLTGLALAASILTGALRWPVLGGVAMIAVLAGALVVGQTRVLPIVGRVAQRLVPGAVAMTDAIGDILARTYANRRRVAASFLLNLLAWFASAAGGSIALRLMAVPVTIGTVLSIESLIFAIRSIAFVIPGGIGVQEAGYALVGPLLGLPAEAALALALAKRARDVCVGLPTLLLWQYVDLRRTWRQRGGAAER